MKIKYVIIFILASMILLYFCIFRMPEIIFVHQNREYTDIVVRNFPLTKVGKLHWWEKNRSSLKEKYGIPIPNENGNYDIIFLDGDNGFKAMPIGSTLFSFGTNDLYCFEEIKSKENCIEKDRFMEIQNWRDNKTMILIGSDEIIK